MRSNMMPVTVLIAFTVGGCDGGSVTSAAPDNLGQEIVEAIAALLGEPPPESYPMVILREGRPVNLTEVAIVDFWNWRSADEPDVTTEIAKYVEGAFPGIVMECDPDPGSKSEHACFPIGRRHVPPEGVLLLGVPPVPPGENRTWVRGRHHYRTSQGEPDWYGFRLELERAEGGWKVGEGRYVCCS